MKRDIPAWAMREAGPGDQRVARDAHGRGTLRVEWPDLGALRDWAKRHGWPTPWLGFDKAFLARMLEEEAGFDQCIGESGIKMRIPRQEHTLSAEDLKELDELYEERSETGRPVAWGSLVEELRAIRRAVEAGVVVKVEGATPMRTWQDFYGWAHGRYHALEDGSDKWIGNDD